jgi:hypothetical protein
MTPRHLREGRVTGFSDARLLPAGNLAEGVEQSFLARLLQSSDAINFQRRVRRGTFVMTALKG